MNSNVFIQRMRELTESINEATRRMNERDRWMSDSWYEIDLDHDYGYESNYRNPYGTHQFPHPHNKYFPTILSGQVSKHQVNDPCNPIRYLTQTNKVVRKQAKPSPFDFSEIRGAPHPMPKGYSEGLPCFYANATKSIEKHLDVVWYYMEAYGA